MIPHVDRPLVYLAAPYTAEPVPCTHEAIMVAETLHAVGTVTVYVPHMNLIWDLVQPHPPTHWLDYDLAILARADALLRMDGHSPGADQEVEFAGELNIPVFYEVDKLLEWAAEVGE